MCCIPCQFLHLPFLPFQHPPKSQSSSGMKRSLPQRLKGGVAPNPSKSPSASPCALLVRIQYCARSCANSEHEEPIAHDALDASRMSHLLLPCGTFLPGLDCQGSSGDDSMPSLPKSKWTSCSSGFSSPAEVSVQIHLTEVSEADTPFVL